MRPPGPFETGARAYDGWYARHPVAYAAELKALRLALPAFARGLEVGVGTARFASSLGLGWGIDPARPMLEIARERGVRAVQAMGEDLPFGEGSFDCVLMVTALCFVRDPSRALAEAGRVLRAGGALALGIVDPESRLGRDYRRRAAGGGFYAGARFLAVPAVLDLLAGGPWSRIGIRQTLFPDGGEDREQPVREGHGEGAFVVVSARKKSRPPRRRGGQQQTDQGGPA